MTLTEREPLLAPPIAQPLPAQIPPIHNLNQVSKAQLYWILAALWTAVFLGALDGIVLSCDKSYPSLMPITQGTIVATLQQPIGDYFQQSHIASYIGTSYLLSICCFTPLYGRLADTLGRKVSQPSAACVSFPDEFDREQWCAIRRHFGISL
jgi:hypothetical protein